MPRVTSIIMAIASQPSRLHCGISDPGARLSSNRPPPHRRPSVCGHCRRSCMQRINNKPAISAEGIGKSWWRRGLARKGMCRLRRATGARCAALMKNNMQIENADQDAPAPESSEEMHHAASRRRAWRRPEKKAQESGGPYCHFL